VAAAGRVEPELLAARGRAVARAVRLAAVRVGGLGVAGPDGGRGDVVDLEGRVGDAPFGQQLLKVGPDAVAVLPPIDKHMGGRGRHAVGDLPDVQVVNLRDARPGGHRAAKLG
jgi:hypothetical protein